EQYVAPESAVLASFLVRALLARNCTTAEAMWAIFDQIDTGRYKAALLSEHPSTVDNIVNEYNPPAGVDVASGVLHIDGRAGDWGLLVITLPKRDDARQAEAGGKSETSNVIRPPKRAKRSTEPGEAREKLIAALTKHHKYAEASCLNQEPIGNNQLARLADV